MRIFYFLLLLLFTFCGPRLIGLGNGVENNKTLTPNMSCSKRIRQAGERIYLAGFKMSFFWTKPEPIFSPSGSTSEPGK